ncbi:hypothetical protein BKA80DRAFT_265391 [Phyllosticta citrichinensis]
MRRCSLTLLFFPLFLILLKKVFKSFSPSLSLHGRISSRDSIRFPNNSALSLISPGARPTTTVAGNSSNGA